MRLAAAVAAAIPVVVAATAAAVIAPSAPAIAAAGEKDDDQNDDPPAAAVTAPGTEITHTRYLRKKICYGLRRTFHVIPLPRKGARQIISLSWTGMCMQTEEGSLMRKKQGKKTAGGVVKLHKGINS